VSAISIPYDSIFKNPTPSPELFEFESPNVWDAIDIPPFQLFRFKANQFSFISTSCNTRLTLIFLATVESRSMRRRLSSRLSHRSNTIGERVMFEYMNTNQLKE
jgi:hypothetical protein